MYTIDPQGTSSGRSSFGSMICGLSCASSAHSTSTVLLYACHLPEAPMTVNGEPEDRRGRQLHDGDIVAAAGEQLRVVAQAAG